MTLSNKPKLNVLIIDPAEENRAILREMLTDIPEWDVYTASSADGIHGLDMMAKVGFDLVFLSWQTPGKKGIETLEQIVQRYPRTTVLMITPPGDEEIAVDALGKGALDFIGERDLPQINMRHLLKRVMAKRSLHQRFDQLRKLNLLKDDFIANVSHELRTPLTVMLGYTRTLLEAKLGPVTDQQKQALQSMEERGNYLLGTINRLLEVKASSEGTDRLLLEPVDLRTLVQTAETRIMGLAARKDLHVATDLPAGEVWVRADEERFQEVLDNVFSNAVKFSPRKGRVAVSLTTEGTDALLTIADEGPGVAEDKLPHIFEEFSRASQGMTREYPGLGLGLALSQQLVELHGGRIWLKSVTKDGGTAACVRLPLCEPDSPEIAIEQPSRLAKKRILIVEDNPDIVDLIRIFLQNFSPNLLLGTAHNGFEALDYLTHNHPHLMILDIMMPGMNGFEVLERLKRLPGRQNIPVLVLTGYQDAAQKAQALGAQAVLSKPFDKNVFIRHVLRLLSPETPASP